MNLKSAGREFGKEFLMDEVNLPKIRLTWIPCDT